MTTGICAYVFPDDLPSRGPCGQSIYNDNHIASDHTYCIGVDRAYCMFHEFVPAQPANEPLVIDITPTDEGFERIASMFIQQVTADITPGRVANDRELLVSIIETAAYLATKERGDLIKALIATARA